MVQVIRCPENASRLLSQLEESAVIPRIWAHDHTVWKESSTEITNRLAWLHLPETMQAEIDRLIQFADHVRDENVRHVLLLGMGGSSLAPEVLGHTFGASDGHPDLTVLDSTHPEAVLAVEDRLDLARTLFIVATKSGTTTETLSFFRYFYARASEVLGRSEAGRRFVAITDPESPLVPLAKAHGFREIFRNDPHLGGRYAALSLFGLVPAALLGIDLPSLLRSARQMSEACAGRVPPQDHPAGRLGAFLAAAAQVGRDKATFILSEPVRSFGSWVEQLIAESTGKEGTGILPVIGEPPGPPDAYDVDRVFLHIRNEGDRAQDAAVDALADAGHPVARLDLQETIELGGQYFLWELATAIVGHVLRINPFDQPNVESAKSLAREMVQRFRRTGALPKTPFEAPDPEILGHFLHGGLPGDYVALQAYLPPTPGAADALCRLRTAIRDRWRRATTVGFGPRFLHSTGQLHKGDRGNGLFIQLLVDPERDVPIPDDDGSTLTFGTLIAAQAGGDRRALIDAGRRVLTIRLDRPYADEQIRQLAGGLS